MRELPQETKAGCYLPQREERLRACIRYAGGIIIIPVYSLQFRTFNDDICLPFHYTDKKENQNFPIYKEIQNGAVAKSYITNGLLIYGEIFPDSLIYWEAFPHI